MASRVNKVEFIVGNTYQRLPRHRAHLDRSGNYAKIHDWLLYVDVIEGNPDVIDKVTFDLGSSFVPQEYVCSSPIPVPNSPFGPGVMRFATRQQTYGSVTASILIRGVGGSSKKVHHSIVLGNGAMTLTPDTFMETRPLRPLRMVKVPDTAKFGIELELTSALGVNPAYIASNIQNRRTGEIQIIDTYTQGRAVSTSW